MGRVREREREREIYIYIGIGFRASGFEGIYYIGIIYGLYSLIPYSSLVSILPILSAI